MRGWIILDSLMALSGLASMASGPRSLRSAVSVAALGLLLLALTLGARFLRGRA